MLTTPDHSAEPIATFGCSAPRAVAETPEQFGDKAAHLIRLAEAGMPVPPGFVLATSVCRDFFQRGRRLPDGFAEILSQHVRLLEKATGLLFGGERRPLLLSVRSGAPVSMPGMLDTVLDIGLSDRTLSPLICLTGNPRHAWDSYRRLVQGYAETVRRLPVRDFDELTRACLEREGVPAASELDALALKQLTREFLDHFESRVGEPFPRDPLRQLVGAVEAVFRSWEGEKATEYRRLHGLEGLEGTAVTIQAMVYGNLGSASGAGVAFTRDPATGEKTLYLDFLFNAQGEDVVSGRRTVHASSGLERALPEVYSQVGQLADDLERLFRDVQDFEFTLQEGRLYLLQTRRAKRTPWAALRIACDMVRERLIDEATALARLADHDLGAIQSVRLAVPATLRPICRGTPAGPGAAVGPIALSPQAAVAMAAAGRTPVLVRSEISTDDIAGLTAAAGVLTSHGGRTSHAAVFARHLNKVCIVGCRELSAPADERRCRMGDHWLSEGDLVSLDGHSGEVFVGQQNVVIERPTAYLEEVKGWKAQDDALVALSRS
jgi:pyruvate, orthophosphate dikinase